MSDFRYEPSFSLHQIDHTDKRFISRLDMERMSSNVEALKVDIAHRGQMDPVGIARLVGGDNFILIYGFTRLAAIIELGWDTIKANVYDGLAEKTAHALNAANNSMRENLNPWERALQIKRLRKAGIPIDRDDAREDSICRLLKMSRRSVFNWLRVVEYNCADLHKSISTGDISLKHALEFADYDPGITVSLLKRCIEDEWTSSELRLRLRSATLHSEGDIASKDDRDSATLHCEDQATDREDTTSENGGSSNDIDNLRKAGAYLMRVTSEDISSMGKETQAKLATGLRMVLEAITGHR